MKSSWIATPLLATTALFLALNGGFVGAADDINADGLKLRGDGTVDDTQPGTARTRSDLVNGIKLRGDGSVDDSQPTGAHPIRTVETIVNDDGSATTTSTRDLTATGAAPSRLRTVETTRDESGNLVERTRTDIRTNADDVVVRERVSTVEIVDGQAIHTRTDIRRNDAGEIIRSRERVESASRVERAERPVKLERAERAERVERVERPEKAERPEKVERSGRG